MPPLPPSAPHHERQRQRQRLRAAGLRLLAPIAEHRLALNGASPIGFLKELYPELSSFYLPLLQVQELHGAFTRYTEGVRLAVLGHAVHPYYGTYAPTRTEHLELFATWLRQYTGPRTRAIDVGTGCGVLALLLARAGFNQVVATDLNPNAVESVRRELPRLPGPPPIEPRRCDLLGDDRTPTDLIVFNPPWIQGKAESLVESALYFEPGLFERFFDQSLAALTPGGRLVLVFSTVLQLVRPDAPHPIAAELARGRLVEVQRLTRKVKPQADRRRTREVVEIWELARPS